MKKATAVLTASLFVASYLQAQQHPKFLTELSIGPSIPVGRFAATSPNGTEKVPGFAKTGLAVQLSGGYYVNRSFGLLVAAGYATHPQNEEARKKSFLTAGAKTTSINSENWQEIKVMAGGFYVAPLGEKWRLVAKLMAGACKTAVPEINWTGIDTVYMVPSSSFDQKIKMPWAFAYQASAGLQYKLNQKWYLGIDAGYFSATPVYKYDFYTYILSPGVTMPVAGRVSGEDKYALSAINALVSIGINF